jgi:hypothetical protein
MDVAVGDAIERIARVLAGQRLSANAGGTSASAAAEVDETWPFYRDDAVAILHTLRVPDEAMARAGDPAIWEAMIAAALGDHDRHGDDGERAGMLTDIGNDPMIEGP